MLRSSFILSVSGPAALLTLLVHPMVQQAADALAAPAAIVAPAPAPVSVSVSIGQTPIVTRDLYVPSISPVHVASVQRSGTSTAPVQPKAGSASEIQPPMKPRRMMRDGCEGAISSLAGPEARRMVPGRCIA